MNFFDLGFSEPFVQFLNSAGYEKPTAIQRALHEPILAGQSVLGLARQGSGSLETLLLPLLARAQAISALVVVPNAEQQLRYQTVWQELSQRWHAQSGAVISTMQVVLPNQLPQLDSQGWHFFGSVLVDSLDETQQAQLLAFAAQLPTTCQQVSLAQQLSPELQAFWQKLAPDAAQFNTLAQVQSLTDVSQQVWPVPSHLKQALLAELCETLRPGCQAVVWVDRPNFAEQLARKLRVRRITAASYLKGYPVAQRAKVLQNWQQGAYRAIIVCDVDLVAFVLPTVSHLVLFDLPTPPVNYQQLLMPMASQCVVWNLVAPVEEERLLDLETENGRALPRQQLPKFDYSVPELMAARSDIREQPRRSEVARPAANLGKAARVAPPAATDTPPAERPTLRRNERPARPAPERDRPAHPSVSPQPQQPVRDRAFHENVRRNEREFVWDPEIPRTWGDRNAARKEPPKTPLVEWDLPPAPEIWHNPPRLVVRPPKYPGLGKPVPTAQAVIAGLATPPSPEPESGNTRRGNAPAGKPESKSRGQQPAANNQASKPKNRPPFKKKPNTPKGGGGGSQPTSSAG